MKTIPLSIRKILVPVDFSELSQHAFAVALQLAQKSQAQIKLLHVVEMPLTAGYGATYASMDMNPVGAYQNYDFMLPELLEQSKQQMEKLAQVGTAAGIIIEQEVTADRIIAKLVSVVTEEQMDLVVIGSEETSGLEEFLIGSDAEEVVRHCPCPVLTVKKQHDFLQINNILFPSDFSPETRQIMPYVAFVQEFFGANLQILHVQTSDNASAAAEERTRMEAFVTENNLKKVQLLVQSNASASEGIMAAIKTSPPDLILMPTHGRTGLAHLFNKSVAESVVNHAAIPVLTFHWPVASE
ncbi:universal stress protein [Adhaeribacter swui]|uniref:Universal stress protein n=1 Tax=Adhaeribacter swui TaxID=2086471 RepID=A0A7G7G2P3_9BACT|nr:universal stress protein [Adhaeribacter swui]QNF31427.1 universal stress protein [Adhaeribacter swui]